MSRRTLLALSLVGILLLATTGFAAAQSGGTKQVGVVVAFPDGTTETAVVTVPEPATTLDALKAAKLQLVTQTGSFGESICKINETGCPESNCFCDETKFWAYYHLTGSAWSAAAEGVGAFVPADKSVEGLAWSGFDANYNPTEQPPVSTFEQLSATANPSSSLPLWGALLLLVVVVAAIVVFALRRRAA